eukprot:2017064-Rhodomonas_salina.1
MLLAHASSQKPHTTLLAHALSQRSDMMLRLAPLAFAFSGYQHAQQRPERQGPGLDLACLTMASTS